MVGGGGVLVNPRVHSGKVLAVPELDVAARGNAGLGEPRHGGCKLKVRHDLVEAESLRETGEVHRVESAEHEVSFNNPTLCVAEGL